ncbi:MAG: hypothetical protein HC919_00840 [Oscillatoriales cyanobacterium SM2_2_1]|nr:hypothetical protein [Oscillatoriales cyanobacterium SM2_2_1]
MPRLSPRADVRIYWATLLAFGTLLIVQNSDPVVQIRFLGVISVPLPLGAACIAATVSGGAAAWAVSALVLGVVNRLTSLAGAFDDELEDDPESDDEDYDEGEEDEDDIIELRYVNRE